MNTRHRTSIDKAVVNVWQREVGQLSARNFKQRLAGSEVSHPLDNLVPPFFFIIIIIIGFTVEVIRSISGKGKEVI